MRSEASPATDTTSWQTAPSNCMFPSSNPKGSRRPARGPGLSHVAEHLREPFDCRPIDVDAGDRAAPLEEEPRRAASPTAGVQGARRERQRGKQVFHVGHMRFGRYLRWILAGPALSVSCLHDDTLTVHIQAARGPRALRHCPSSALKIPDRSQKMRLHINTIEQGLCSTSIYDTLRRLHRYEFSRSEESHGFKARRPPSSDHRRE